MRAPRPSLSRLLARLLSFGIVALAVSAAPARAQTAYYDYTLAQHLGRYVALKSAGYRMISLDIAGDRNDHRYAAVWVQMTGPEFDSIHGVSESQLTQWTSSQRALGYREHLITAAGSGASTVYACVMVKDGRKWAYAPAMDRAVFDNVDLFSRASGYRLVSAAVHGTASAPRYAAVWAENYEQVQWGMAYDDSASAYQTHFNAFVNDCWARPAFVTHSSSQRYLSVFTDDSVGSWAARHGLTKLGYATEVANMAKLGLEPIQVSVTGVGLRGVYAAIFATRQTVYRRVTTTGVQVPAFDHVDRHMVGRFLSPGFMQQTQARAAAIAVAKDGRLVFARAYTYARPGYPVASPTTGFRIGSLSKSLTAIALYQLMSRRSTLDIDSKLYEKVSFPTIADPDFKKITLAHLVDHRSGYHDYWGDDTLDKLARARSSVAGYSLKFAPGSQEDYSNPGYQMLGLVLESQSGRSYQSYLKTQLFQPLGVVRPFLLSTQPDPAEARCHETITWKSGTSYRGLAIRPSQVLLNNPLGNAAYAVSPFALDASGGWTMSAVDYVRVMAGVFDDCVIQTVIDDPTRQALEARIQMSGRTGGWDYAAQRSGYKSYRKGGLWHSGHAWAVRRTDGISIVALCAGPSTVAPDTLDDLVDAVNSWPTHDLFPNYGLPAFKKHIRGTATPFGVGCQGSNGWPTHRSSGVPEVGRTQSFDLTYGPAGRLGMLMIGISKTNWGRSPLPMDLSWLGATGCRLFVSPDVSLPVTTGRSGDASLAITHPSDPALIGGTFFTQFVILDPGTNQLGAVYSNAVETVLGGIR